jgi:hypothetical protein
VLLANGKNAKYAKSPHGALENETGCLKEFCMAAYHLVAGKALDTIEIERECGIAEPREGYGAQFDLVVHAGRIVSNKDAWHRLVRRRHSEIACKRRPIAVVNYRLQVHCLSISRHAWLGSAVGRSVRCCWER